MEVTIVGLVCGCHCSIFCQLALNSVRYLPSLDFISSYSLEVIKKLIKVNIDRARQNVYLYENKVRETIKYSPE